jgi:hypothetical protein
VRARRRHAHELLRRPEGAARAQKVEAKKAAGIHKKCGNRTPVANPPFCCRFPSGNACVLAVDRADCTNNIGGDVQEGKDCISGNCDPMPGQHEITWWENCPNETCGSAPLATLDDLIACVDDVADETVDDLCQQFAPAGACRRAARSSIRSYSRTGPASAIVDDRGPPARVLERARAHRPRPPAPAHRSSRTSASASSATARCCPSWRAPRRRWCRTSRCSPRRRGARARRSSTRPRSAVDGRGAGHERASFMATTDGRAVAPGSAEAEIVPEIPVAESIRRPRLGVSPMHATELDRSPDLGVHDRRRRRLGEHRPHEPVFDAVNAGFRLVVPRDAVAAAGDYVDAVFTHTLGYPGHDDGGRGGGVEG